MTTVAKFKIVNNVFDVLHFFLTYMYQTVACKSCALVFSRHMKVGTEYLLLMLKESILSKNSVRYRVYFIVYHREQK